LFGVAAEAGPEEFETKGWMSNWEGVEEEGVGALDEGSSWLDGVLDVALDGVLDEA
jgi:hypothetical protein